MNAKNKITPLALCLFVSACSSGGGDNGSPESSTPTAPSFPIPACTLCDDLGKSTVSVDTVYLTGNMMVNGAQVELRGQIGSTGLLTLTNFSPFPDNNQMQFTALLDANLDSSSLNAFEFTGSTGNIAGDNTSAGKLSIAGSIDLDSNYQGTIVLDGNSFPISLSNTNSLVGRDFTTVNDSFGIPYTVTFFSNDTATLILNSDLSITGTSSAGCSISGNTVFPNSVTTTDQDNHFNLTLKVENCSDAGDYIGNGSIQNKDFAMMIQFSNDQRSIFGFYSKPTI